MAAQGAGLCYHLVTPAVLKMLYLPDSRVEAWAYLRLFAQINVA